MLAVVDTNVLLVSVSAKSKFHWIYQLILSKKISIAVTNETVAEYEDQFASHCNPLVASLVVRTLLELSNVYKTEIHFHWNLIHNDPDDNTFVDCAIGSNADFIITSDAHFNVLLQMRFPVVKDISVKEFQQLMEDQKLL